MRGSKNNRFDHRIAAAAAAVFAVLAAGCGGGTDASSSQGQLGAALAAARSAPLAAAPQAAQPLRQAALPDAQAADALFNLGESAFSQYFPNHQPTQSSYPPFLFRYYPTTNTYLGVVVQSSQQYTNGGVYVMGGAFGNSPLPVGLLGQYVFAWDTPGANWDQSPWQ